MNVQQEDFVYRLFPYTFENKSSTWCFSLPQVSIASWNIFETTFIENFCEDKTPTTLFVYLYSIKMDEK